MANESLEVRAALGELPEFLTTEQVLRLWHGPGWRDRRNHAAQVDKERLRRAIEAKTLACEYVPAKEVVLDRSPVETRRPGLSWSDEPDGEPEKEWISSELITRLYPAAAPQTVTAPAVYKIHRNAMRAWLALPGSPQLPDACLLRAWWPAGTVWKGPRPEPLGPSDLVSQARDLIASGMRLGAAARSLADQYGFKATSIQRAVRRDGQSAPVKDAKRSAVTAGKSTGNKRRLN